MRNVHELKLCRAEGFSALLAGYSGLLAPGVVLGSIPNGAGTMVLRCFLFSPGAIGREESKPATDIFLDACILRTCSNAALPLYLT